jgi:cysteinyl-tRNA synthetase
MSRKYLGETIDIHAGGEDLVFPHHENEIAQSEASSGKPFANYWMHNAFLNIDNRKMSKSLGNFFTVRDILDQYDGKVIRYFMQTVHYRSPLNFSRDLMESAKTSYERIVNCAENLTFLEGKAAGSLTEEEKALIAQADAYRVQFEEAMDDDFNTANALSAIFELVTFINSHADGNASRDLLLAFHKELAALTDICGLTLERKNDLAEDEVAYIEAKIAERKAAKKAKDFARADAIRAELKEKGIILEDTREGVKWKKA